METASKSNHISKALILSGPTGVARCNAACVVELLLRADYFFLGVLLNETPIRIETLRMRSGVRFMIRAASSNDFEDFASSMTRRSSANDHDLAIRRALL